MTDVPPRGDVLTQYRTWDPPLEEFDPRVAPTDLLRNHGFPRRPDPDAEPQLTRLWQRAFERPMTLLRAELEVDELLRRRNPLHRREPDFELSGWGGIVVPTPSPSTDPADMVFGEFVVPSVDAHNAPADDMLVGFWVGLDGWQGGGEQVLQAGVAAYVHAGQVYWYAWTEWYTGEYQDPPVTVSNFPVHPGDSIAVLVCAPEPDHAHITLTNWTYGNLCNIGISARPGITSAGTSAEWVIEAPREALPYFYSVRFTECAGATPQRLFDLDEDAIPTNITGPGSLSAPWGHVLTDSWVDTATQAVVRWKGFE